MSFVASSGIHVWTKLAKLSVGFPSRFISSWTSWYALRLGIPTSGSWYLGTDCASSSRDQVLDNEMFRTECKALLCGWPRARSITSLALTVKNTVSVQECLSHRRTYCVWKVALFKADCDRYGAVVRDASSLSSPLVIYSWLSAA
jgi:hypothetical protein